MDTTTPETAAQRRHESPELGAMCARMIRALYVRAGEKDTEALEQLAALEQLLPTAVAMSGWQLHKRGGYSYSELAAVLGTSRQAAIKRFGAASSASWRPNAWRFFGRLTSATEYMSQLVDELASRRAS